MIPKRAAGPTGLQISELGFGGSGLGNLNRPVSDADARATLDAALAVGIRYVDTAPYYGFGLSERRVGDGLRGQDCAVSTKVGRLLSPDPGIRSDAERSGFRSAMPFTPVYDYRYDAILRSFEASLHRLGLANIDLLYVHDIGRMTHGDAHPQYFAQLTDGGGLRALERLRDGGAISGFGLGVNEVAVCLEVMEHARLDTILLAGRYTLLEQGALDALLPACADADTAIVVGGVYNSGILATGVGKGVAYYDYAPAPPHVVARVARIEAVAARHGVTLAAAALQFPLAHPQVASVIPGLGEASRVAQTLSLYHEVIPPAFWSELRDAGLLDRDAPVPA